MNHQTSTQQRGTTVLRYASALALALQAAGCADLQRIPREPARPTTFNPVGRDQREADMNRRWQDRPLTELVAALGKPQLTMNIPGGGNPPGFAVVYGQDMVTGCIDAFAVNGAREPTIRIYYCR